MITNLIRDGMVAIGETKLGIKCWEIRTHSIWSSPAMAMYLAGVPIFSIMLIGQWSSTAFLKYIWKQVQEFLHGILSKMIKSSLSSMSRTRLWVITPPQCTWWKLLVTCLRWWWHKLTERASPPTDGGGVVPTKIGPNPNLSSHFISQRGRDQDPPPPCFIFHISCHETQCAYFVHFSFLVRKTQYQGLPWQGSLCFWEFTLGGVLMGCRFSIVTAVFKIYTESGRHHLPALISSYLAGGNTSSKKLTATKNSTV